MSYKTESSPQKGNTGRLSELPRVAGETVSVALITPANRARDGVWSSFCRTSSFCRWNKLVRGWETDERTDEEEGNIQNFHLKNPIQDFLHISISMNGFQLKNYQVEKQRSRRKPCCTLQEALHAQERIVFLIHVPTDLLLVQCHPSPHTRSFLMTSLFFTFQYELNTLCEICLSITLASKKDCAKGKLPYIFGPFLWHGPCSMDPPPTKEQRQKEGSKGEWMRVTNIMKGKKHGERIFLEE